MFALTPRCWALAPATVPAPSTEFAAAAFFLVTLFPRNKLLRPRMGAILLPIRIACGVRRHGVFVAGALLVERCSSIWLSLLVLLGIDHY